MTEGFLIEAGTVSRVELLGDAFDAIREIVGGYIEPIVSSDGRVTLWCNEDGKPLCLPENGVATALWWRLVPTAPRNDRLVGPVVVTGAQDEDGVGSPPDDVADIFRSWVNPA